MAFTRFTFQGCGESTHYYAYHGDPQEVREQMKYLNKTVYADVCVHENSWWGTVEFLIKNPGCNWRELTKTHKTQWCSTGYYVPKSTMAVMVVKMGTPGRYKYYASDLAKELYAKYKNVTPSDTELAKRKAKAKKQFEAAKAEEGRYRMLCETAKLEKTIDETLE